MARTPTRKTKYRPYLPACTRNHVFYEAPFGTHLAQLRPLGSRVSFTCGIGIGVLGFPSCAQPVKFGIGTPPDWFSSCPHPVVFAVPFVLFATAGAPPLVVVFSTKRAAKPPRCPRPPLGPRGALQRSAGYELALPATATGGR